MANYAIIDSNGFCFKYFSAIEPMLDKEGVDNRVLFGFLGLLNKLVQQIEDLNYVFVVFDPPNGNLYRQTIFPAYKANRPPKDPEFEKQKTATKVFLEKYLGVPVISFDGFEADDIVGSLAKYFAKDKTNKITVVSPDKDLLQLVQDNICILRPFKKNGNKGYEFITEEGVFNKFGVVPSLIPDVLALMGDDVDNIPKVGGIGEKTAAKLLNQYISLEHLMSVAHEIDGIIGENLRNSVELLPTIKKLTTIKTDLELSLHVEKSLKKAKEIQSHIGYKHKIEEFQYRFNFKDDVFNIFLQTEEF